MQTLKLFKVLIGCTPKGRNTEQHDVFFGIANSIKDLVPQLKEFWPEAANKMHIDAFREVNIVDGYKVLVVEKSVEIPSDAFLFFINLGGYKPDEFDEFHYKIIIAAPNKTIAIQLAKETTFYKHTGYKGAASHIDDKFGVDVDDIHNIDDILSSTLKQQYKIVLQKDDNQTIKDKYNLGYFKLSKIENGDFASE